MSFTTWIISLSTMLSRSNNAVSKGRSSFFLSAVHPLCKCTLVFCCQSSMQFDFLALLVVYYLDWLLFFFWLCEEAKCFYVHLPLAWNSHHCHFLFQDKALIKPFILSTTHIFTSEIEGLYTNEFIFTIRVTYCSSLPMLLQNFPCQNNLTEDINNPINTQCPLQSF